MLTCWLIEATTAASRIAEVHSRHTTTRGEFRDIRQQTRQYLWRPMHQEAIAYGQRGRPLGKTIATSQLGPQVRVGKYGDAME